MRSAFGGMGTWRGLMVAGASLCISGAAWAQAGNPFLPGSSLSPEQVEKMVDERLTQAMTKLQPAPTIDPKTGKPMEKGLTGANVPGGMGPPTAGIAGMPGAVGGAGAAENLPPVQGALKKGVRFVGCINGQPNFRGEGGARVVFAPADVRDALKAGAIPQCR